MSDHAYTEDQLVERPAIDLFAVLGWAVAGPPPTAGIAGEPRDAGLLGRETKGEDFSGVLERVNSLLDESIEGVTMSDHPVPVLDLSKINFEALARQFKASPRKQLELEDLKAAIRRLLDRLFRLNRTRIDFQEKFEELIEAYNAGSKNIEELFQQLLDLSRSLTEEEQRHVREHLSEEELTVFDLLTRPGPELTPAEREEVKKAARHQLERVKQVLVLDWGQRGTARARVRLAIEDTLDDELPRSFTPELFTQKVSTVFEHIYETYRGEQQENQAG